MGWIPLGRSEETWENGCPVNTDMVIKTVITISVIVNGVIADLEQGGERGVGQGVVSRVSRARQLGTQLVLNKCLPNR